MARTTWIPPERAAIVGTAAKAPGSGWLRWALLGAGAGAGIGSLLAGATSGLAAYFARQVVTPQRARAADLDILAVTGGDFNRQVVLPATADTVIPGTYGLFFDGGRGHARIGAIRSYVPRDGTVARDVEEVEGGDLSRARKGWWSGTPYPRPSSLGLEEHEVRIPVESGTAPAWLIRAADDAPVWAIMVHGRGASRSEGLRAVRTAKELGLTSLLISYRNDGDAPAAVDGRYGLGETEWVDVEAAIGYALSHGAREVVLFGWSMGGAISLQAADLSRYRHLIRALVLDGPVINWIDVLAHQARLNRVPEAIGEFSQFLLSHRTGRRLTGLAAPVNLKSMNWVARSDELRTPTLILHSEDDDFVPSGPSAALAASNPQMVTFQPFSRAGHTREWNVDPERWEQAVRAWLGSILARSR